MTKRRPMFPRARLAHDHAMIAHARRRGPVSVTLGDRTMPATLVAWCLPSARNGARARVQYASGYQRSVPLDAVQVVEHTSGPARLAAGKANPAQPFLEGPASRVLEEHGGSPSD